MADEKICPQCGRSYGANDRFCTVDGATLVNAGNSGSLIGTVLAERYLVSERLGEGGMGEVYLAEHVRMKRKVAVKIMRRWMAGDPVAVSRFHREAENASQITHPNVAQVYDFGETSDGTIYLAMEFVPGEPLSKILEREGKLHAVRSQEIVRQTADALVAAHGMGILHRDLKPDNVMVARSRAGTDIVKLVDFGIARVMTRGTQQFTSTGMIVGTPEYMSPEQLANDNLDERSDLYALGLIAFRTLTGHGAFPDGTTGDALLARLTNRARKLADVAPDVAWPESLQAAFDKVLAADPTERFADALEFAAELDGAVSQMPLSDEEQAYLVALTQRSATPVRLGTIDGVTPSIAMKAANLNTPAVPRPSVALRTPPSEQLPALTGDTAPFKPPAPPTSFGSGDTGEREPPIMSLPESAEQEPPHAASPETAEPTPPRKPTPTVERPAIIIELPPESGEYATPGPAFDEVGTTTPSVAMPAYTEPSAATRTPPIDATAAADAGLPKRKSGSNKKLMIAGGVFGIAIIAALAMKMSGGSAPTTTPPTAVAPTTTPTDKPTAGDSIAAPSAAIAPATDSAAGAGGPAADSQRVARVRNAVLVTQSANGTSSALLVDGQGLLVTAASAVPRDRRVDLFVDGDQKVKATVVKVDDASGIAVLLASVGPCKRCRAVDVAPDDATPPIAAKDSVVILAASRRGVQSLVREVQSAPGASSNSVAMSGTIPSANIGAPVIAPHTGAVAGLVVRRGGSVSVASAATVAAVVKSARSAAASMTPNDSLFWSWPTRPVPQDAIDAGGKLSDSAIAPYKVTKDGFTVFAVTPPVLAWRYVKSGAAAADAANPFVIPGAATPKPADPAAEWKQWGRYLSERRAVVIFDISPEQASFPEVPKKLLDPKDGDFFSMELKRDGTTLIPIESQRVASVVKQDEYGRKNRRVPNAGLYVYHPMDFASTTAKYTMEIADQSGRRVSVALPAAMIEGIAKDLGGWQKR